jgi:uncharacterized membrane protein
MAAMTRRTNEALRARGVANVNEVVEERLTPLQRVADGIARFSGSMAFLFLNAFWFLGWIAANTLDLGVPQFDPFPFGLLTMIVSLEAIFLSCFVLISQSRRSEKDRVRDDVEYEINARAEREIAHLHQKADRMYEQMSARFRELEKQLEPERAARRRVGGQPG